MPTPNRPLANRPLIVQQSFPAPRPTTNPYIVMLGSAIAGQPGVVLRTFSWRGALTRRFDVFHVHWPEILVSGQSPLKALVRQGLFLVLLAKLRVTRTPIVRTMHNLELPQGISRRERALLTLADRQVALRINLNDNTVLPDGQASETILHGHYRHWFAEYQKPRAISGRLGYFGLIRRYKGVETLLTAFHDIADEKASLRVAGRPSSAELAESLERLASVDPRIDLTLQFLSDEELVTVAGESELVVLPYREMHNSGGALTALSLSRPVLLPANAVNEKLSAEVGQGWVLQYLGELDAAALQHALDTVHSARRSAEPDLSARDWTRAGADHVAAYRRAIEIAQGRGQ